MGKKTITLLKIVGILILNFILSNVLNVIFNVTHLKVQEIDKISVFLSSLLIVMLFRRTLYISFKKENLKKSANGLLVGVITSVSLVVILLSTSQGVINENLLISLFQGGVKSKLMLLVLNLLIYSIAEEIIYRGFIFNELKKKFSMVTTFILVALLYSFSNFAFVIESPIFLVNKFILSILLTLFVYKFNSLEYSIVFNFITKVITAILIRSTGMELLTGGNSGIFSGLIFTLVLVLLLFYYVKRENIKLKISFKTTVMPVILSLILIGYTVLDYNIWHKADIIKDNKEVKAAPVNNDLNEYTLNWQIDTSKRKIYGNQEISYINTSKDNLKEVYFHGYAAAFKKFGGDIAVEDVSVNNSKSTFDVEGEDSTLIKIPLSEELKPQQRVDIKLKYTIDIPQRSNNGFADRFAYGNNTINLGNCFPIAAVYEDGKWDKHIYDEKGDAFYSECSNFKINIKAPEKYQLAVTGEIKNIEETDGFKLWDINASNVRDFAVVASDRFSVEETNVDGTIVKAYAFDKVKAKKVLEFSSKAIKTFNKRFGEYPYSTCSVVQTDLNGGMEYPTMVMISSDAYNNISPASIGKSFIYKRLIGDLEDITVHELAHQWWYGIVGNDEYNEAWVDEPMTQFSTLLYYKDIYGEDRFNSIYSAMFKMQSQFIKSSLKDNSFKRPLNKFNDSDYEGLIYILVPTLIKDKYDELGDEKFNEIFRETFEKYKFKVLKGKEFPLDLKE